MVEVVRGTRIALPVQTLLYFGLVVASLTVIVAMAQEFSSMPDNECIIYSKPSWHGHFQLQLGAHGKANCRYIIGLSAATLVYGIGLTSVGILFLVARKFREKDMIILPLCLSNTLLFCMLLVAGCLLSVGILTFCNTLEDISKTYLGSYYFDKCSSIEDSVSKLKRREAYFWLAYKHDNTAKKLPDYTMTDFTFYKWINICQVAVWPMCGISLLLAVINWLRFFFDLRNRGKSDEEPIVNSPI